MDKMTHLKLFKYNTTSGNWENISLSSSKLHKSRLTLMTFNVWFNTDANFLTRADAIFQIIQDKSPDIICLQEVTIEFINAMKNDVYIQNNYATNDVDGSFVGDYGCTIMLKHDNIPNSLVCLSIPTEMERNCVLAKFKCEPNYTLVVATVHLESLNSQKLREEQLKVISKALNKADTSVLMGDFNFDDVINYDQLLQLRNKNETRETCETLPESNYPLENDALKIHFANYSDVWPLLQIGTGYTYDTDTNKMLSKISQYEQMRYDRIVLRSKNWQPKSIELIGNEIIENTSLFPSDHYGLVMTMEQHMNQNDDDEECIIL